MTAVILVLLLAVLAACTVLEALTPVRWVLVLGFGATLLLVVLSALQVMSWLGG